MPSPQQSRRHPRSRGAQDVIIELSHEADEERYGNARVRARITAMARGLLKHGLQRGEAVAIVAANCADYLVLYMATMPAGVVSVRVNCCARRSRTS